jgi:hypothetical protein
MSQVGLHADTPVHEGGLASNSARPIPEPLPDLGGAQVRAIAGEDLIGQLVQHLARLGELVVLKVGVRDPGHRDQLGDCPAPQGLGDVNDIARISPFDFPELAGWTAMRPRRRCSRGDRMLPAGVCAWLGRCYWVGDF